MFIFYLLAFLLMDLIGYLIFSMLYYSLLIYSIHHLTLYHLLYHYRSIDSLYHQFNSHNFYILTLYLPITLFCYYTHSKWNNVSTKINLSSFICLQSTLTSFLCPVTLYFQCKVYIMKTEFLLPLFLCNS